MDWVHCNTCYYQPGQQPKREFRLSSCGHIFCQNCEGIGSIEKCKICKAPGSTIVLSPEMGEEVQTYFEDEESIIEKLCKVSEFHKSHRHRLNEHYRTVVSKYNSLKEHYFRVINENKKLHQEIKMFKQKLEEKSRNMSSHHILTPPQSQSKHQFSPFFNNSQTSSTSFRHNSSSHHGISPASSLFVTPTHGVLTPKNYRSQSQMTPCSDISDSPGSDLGIDYRGRQSQVCQPQIPRHNPGFTPPINGLRNLSVKRRNP